MNQRPLKPDFTVNQDSVGLSLMRPVRVLSVNDLSSGDSSGRPVSPDSKQEIVYLRPGAPGHPGGHYGVVVESEGFRITRPHDHDYFEISIIRGGSVIHCTENERKPLGPGMVIVLQPGLMHGFENPEGFQQTNIYYLAEWLLEDVAEYWEEEGLVPLFFGGVLFRGRAHAGVPHFQLDSAELQAANRDLASVSEELERERPSLIMLKASFLRFLIVLSRSYSRQAREPVGMRFRREVWVSLHMIERVIRQRVPFRVEQSAHEVGLSTSHFSAIFKQETGWAPMDYYQRRRIQHAGRLLMLPDLSVAEVAYTLGFCHSAHFSTLFKTFHGISPRAYRELYLYGTKTE